MTVFCYAHLASDGVNSERCLPWLVKLNCRSIRKCRFFAVSQTPFCIRGAFVLSTSLYQPLPWDRPGSGQSFNSLFPGNNVVNKQWFNGEDVPLDGWTFTNCRFDNCRLHVTSTTFLIDKCFIGEGTTIHYGGDVVKIIKLFHMKNDFMRSHHPHFAPTFHGDGTVSIGIA